jgi:choline-sulfatase
MTRRPFAALALLVLGCLACRAPLETPRSVLLVSVDTIRADRIGCYGREGAGTPTLDALAERGTRFADAMTPTPITLPSHATLLTGQNPLRHGVRHNGLFALPGEAVTLAERLRGAGFRTGAFVGSIVLAERHGLAQGFEAYTSPALRSSPALFFLGERPAGEVNRDALAWIDGIGADPFFLLVHYMEPHAPFEPGEPERSAFPDDPYQAEIAAADRALGELLAGLAARQRLESTLVVVVGDHGEALSDHGELSHGIFLYQSTLHVPMLFAGPGVRERRVIPEPVGLVDVAPTLLQALDVAATGPLDGRSLWPALGGAPLEPRSLYAETFQARFDYGWSELRALRRGPRKYIQAPRPELYDLELDPAESRNLLEEVGADAEPIARELEELIARSEERAIAPERVELGPDQRAALEALGYVSGSREGDVSLARADPKDRFLEAVWMDQATRLMRQRDYAQAEHYLRRLIVLDPTFIDGRLRLMVALMAQEKLEEAEIEGRALIERAREMTHGDRIAARAQLLLAGMYTNERRFEEAAVAYERALATPQPPEVHTTLGAIYHDLGRRDDAIRVLRVLEERGDPTPRSREILRYLEGKGPPPTPGSSENR